MSHEKVAPDGETDLIERLNVLRKKNADRSWVNKDLYRILYKLDLYIIAYERIKSKPGNMTEGTDGKTIDGTSVEEIAQIIREIRDESYQPKPVKTVYIPKSDGKLRKLGIPSFKDKLIQEGVRMVLEAIYDSPQGSYFLDSSHGFRSGRSCHSAIREIQRKWSGVNWFLEGDIAKCFDDINHEKLIRIMELKIQDTRLLNLIRKLLNAGYMETQGVRRDLISGTPQGGIISPILANIYLTALDEYIEKAKRELEQKPLKDPNPEYRELVRKKEKLAKEGKTKTTEFRETLNRLRVLPSLKPNDEHFVRIKYIRYADDWLIGIMGSKAKAQQFKESIKNFLKEELDLHLSGEKTIITNAREKEAKFLGFRIKAGRTNKTQKVTTSTNASKKTFKRRSTGWEIIVEAPIDELIKKLEKKGFAKEGKPVSKSAWSLLDQDQIILLFSAINRGIQNYYRPCDNFVEVRRIQYILKFSLGKTLGEKMKIGLPEVIRTGKMTYKYQTTKGEKAVTFYKNTDWTTKREAFNDLNGLEHARLETGLRTRSRLGAPCCLCGESKSEMHHVRHIRKMDTRNPQGFTKVLSALGRKQIPVCQNCHQKIHQGKYDGLKLSDLSYNPNKTSITW